jgi:hypothetical protein
MMKKICFLLSFLCFFNKLNAQQDTSIQQQQIQRFESGQKYLRKGKLEIAISEYDVAFGYDKKSNIGIISRKKIDSLLPIAQKKIIKQWKGNWKLKELHNKRWHSVKFSEYIHIDDNKIVFYRKDSNGKDLITRSEPIRFFSYDSVKSFLNIRKVVFENSEIWSFSAENKKSQKRLYPTLERDSSGISYRIIDERGFTMDRKARRRAQKIEIYTYYVIAK